MMIYLKCVIANRFTLAGYLIILSALFFLVFKEDSVRILPLIIFGLWAGLLLLMATKFGFETFDAYRSMKNHIEIKGYPEKWHNIGPYCTRVGLCLALKELAPK